MSASDSSMQLRPVWACITAVPDICMMEWFLIQLLECGLEKALLLLTFSLCNVMQVLKCLGLDALCTPVVRYFHGHAVVAVQSYCCISILVNLSVIQALV